MKKKDKSCISGGSAAIKGFLYQILAHLSWISEIHLSGTLDQETTPKKAYLVLEPINGGDAWIEGENLRIVEQYKTNKKRTWSLTQIIEDVLPDLARSYSDKSSKYCFVTDGRCKHLISFYEFLNKVRHISDESDIIFQLNDEPKIHKFKGEKLSDKELFLTIADKLFKESNTKEKFIRTLNLLKNLEIKDEIDDEIFRKKIDKWLEGIVDYIEDITEKREQLCAKIMEKIAQGPIKISPEELLKEVGLDVIHIKQWSKFKLNLTNMIKKTLKNLGFSPDLNVRSTPKWTSNSFILIISGESGQGKTWSLCQLAQQAIENKEIVVFLIAKGDAEKDLQEVSKQIWCESLDHDKELPIDRVVKRIRKQEFFKISKKPWLTVFIDDVHRINEGRELLKKPWEEWGIRLAISVPFELARILKNEKIEDVDFISLSDFTRQELNQYLSKYNKDLNVIPQDLWNILKRPFVAKLFCEITDENKGWIPASEYELFKRYWDRIVIESDGYDYANDRVILLKLIEKFLNNKIYPWAQTLQYEVGLTDEVRQRLEKKGWLRRIDNTQRVEIWHDRLLNWAVAEYLIEQWRCSRINISQLAEKLCEFIDNNFSYKSKPLGYVPMDFLWLASNEENFKPQDIAKIIIDLEKSQNLRGNVKVLYYDLLSTLGDLIVPILIIILKEDISTADPQSLFRANIIVKTLIKIGKQHPDIIKSEAIKLFASENFLAKKAALKILAEFPMPEVLDEIWEIHKKYCSTLDGPREKRDYDGYQASFNALKLALQENSEWLVEKIKTANPENEPVWELGYLLINLERNQAKKIWYKYKKLLFSKILNNKSRSLILCVRQFYDTQEIPFLLKNLKNKDDFASIASFSALCQLDPNNALNVVEEMDDSDLYIFRNWWREELIFSQPKKFFKRVAEIARKKDRGWRFLVNIFCDLENWITSTDLKYLIDNLQEELENFLESSETENFLWLFYPLCFLNRIHRLELLKVIESFAGSLLEQMLVVVGKKCVDSIKGRSSNPVLKEIYGVLSKIGGTGIVELVNYELSKDDRWKRLEGLEWAYLYYNNKTKTILKQILTSKNKKELLPYERSLILNCLAVLGEDKSVIETIRESNGYISDELIALRTKKRALNFQYLKPLTEDLKSPDENICLNALISIWYAGNKKFKKDVFRMLENADPEATVARISALILHSWGEQSPKFIDLVKQQLLTRSNFENAINILISIKNKLAIRTLITYLEKKNIEEYSNIDWKLVLRLYCISSTSNTVIKIIRSYIKKELFRNDYNGYLLEILGDFDDDKTLEILSEEAFKACPLISRRIQAIKGLIKRNINDALYAAKHLINKYESRDYDIIDKAAKLIVNYGGDQAIKILIDCALQCKFDSTRWVIARALRLVNDKSILSIELKNLLKSKEKKIRKIACTLLRWQYPGFLEEHLKKLVNKEIYDDVRQEAMKALRNQEEQAWILELIELFKRENKRRLEILINIIEWTDPFILTTKEDPLWLGHILEDVPYYFIYFANKYIKKRKDEVEKYFRNLDLRNS